MNRFSHHSNLPHHKFCSSADCTESQKPLISCCNSKYCLRNAGMGSSPTCFKISRPPLISLRCSLMAIRHSTFRDRGRVAMAASSSRYLPRACVGPGRLIHFSSRRSQPAATKNLALSRQPRHTNQHSGNLLYCLQQINDYIEM